jgi:hypothetical protein
MPKKRGKNFGTKATGTKTAAGMRRATPYSARDRGVRAKSISWSETAS